MLVCTPITMTFVDAALPHQVVGFGGVGDGVAVLISSAAICRVHGLAVLAQRGSQSQPPSESSIGSGASRVRVEVAPALAAARAASTGGACWASLRPRVVLVELHRVAGAVDDEHALARGPP